MLFRPKEPSALDLKPANVGEIKVILEDFDGAKDENLGPGFETIIEHACVESFFGSLNVDAIQYKPIMNQETMRQVVFEYIEVDCNRTRRHSALGHISPEDFESQYVV